MKNVYSKDKNSKNYTENCLLAYFQGFLAISIMKIQGCCILWTKSRPIFFNALKRQCFLPIFTFESIGKSSLLIERWMLEASLPRLWVQKDLFRDLVNNLSRHIIIMRIACLAQCGGIFMLCFFGNIPHLWMGRLNYKEEQLE
jgi:hypothetical protein